MLDNSEIRFLPLGARRVAYEIRGDGPPLVAPAWWVSHLELDWQNADFRRFWEGVADGYALIRYDRLGVGMSDRTLQIGPDDRRRSRDAACAARRTRLERVTFLGGSCGSCTAIAFAAAYPERVERLVLYGSYPDGAEVTPPGVADAIIGAVRAHWGLGARLLSDIFLGGAEPAEHERFAQFQREAATAETAAALLALVYRLDVRDHLPVVRAPARSCIVATTAPSRSGSGVRSRPRFLARRSFRCRAARTSRGMAMSTPLSAHAAKCWDRRSRRRTASDPEPILLSGREREIFSCVARGLSDREIAEQLVLSSHTVHRHVANIRRKLGRTSRSAAVAEAARLGLL